MKLSGGTGIGHTRYSTVGNSDWLHCQPLVVHSIHGPIAVAHNGELVDANPLRQEVHYTHYIIEPPCYCTRTASESHHLKSNNYK